MRRRAKVQSAIGAVLCGVVLCLGVGAAQAAEHLERPTLSLEGLAEPCGVATDSQGDLYVVQNGEVFIYDETGASPVELTHFAPTANEGYACSIAVDGAGNVYVGGLAFEGGEPIARNLVKYKPKGGAFPPTGTTEYEADTAVNGTGVLVPTGRYPNAVAVDPETERVYVAEGAVYERQSLGFTGFATGDKFTLTCDGEATEEIEYSGPAAARSNRIKAALEAKCGSGNFIVTGTNSPSPTSTISYKGKYLTQNVPPTICAVITGAGTCTVTTVADGAPSRVSSFNSDGSVATASIGEGLIPGADFYGIDVYGETGEIYVADRAHAKAYVLSPTGSSVEAEIDGSGAPAGGFGAMTMPYLAVDQSNGDVIVSDLPHGVADEFTKAGSFVTEISHAPPFEGNGSVAPDIAVDNGSASHNQGTVYVSSADGHVYAFGPLPGGSPHYPLSVTKTGGGSGSVTSAPSGIDCGAACDAEFQEGKHVTLTAGPVLGSVIGAWSGCDTVNVDNECEVDIDGARKVVVRFDSRPLVSAEAATQVTDSSALLGAKVNPKGKATSYRFEYVSQEAWEDEGFAAAVKAPSSDVEIGGGTTDIPVSVKVEGLEPLRSYRFRVVAVNAIGTADGERDAGTDEEIERSFTTYSAPEVGVPCPNDSLRTGPSTNLPDCRAYEQASPMDKNGGSIQATAPAASTAEDGSTITFESTAGIPGGAGSQNFPTYMAKRGPSGWATTGLLPNPSSGQRAAVLGWTPDFATVFDRAELFGEGISLLARSTTEGAQTEMVPHTSPEPDYAYVDSSVDGNTTIFEAGQFAGTGASTLQLTSKAAPGKPNVYAWNRNDPTNLHLGGVLPDGSTPTQGSRVGRGIGAAEYNRSSGAVADDGSVFFNANDAEGQLYLRLNPTAEETDATDGKGDCVPDSALACTVHVSASQKDNGKGPGNADSAGPQPAYLKAASRDGSRAVFTSSEKLTNDANTGPEPDAPSIARASIGEPPCTPAPCEMNPTFIPAFAHEIAIDAVEEYVYWTDPERGRIGRAKLDGTGVDGNYVITGGEPLGIAVVDEPSAKYIFWTDRGELDERGEPQEEAGIVGRASLDGSNVDASCYEGLTNPRSIAATSSFVYWTSPFASSTIGTGDLGRAEVDDCSDEASKNPAFIAGNINFVGGDIAVNSSYIYVSSFNEGANQSPIIRFTINGGDSGSFALLVGETTGPVGLAVNGANLYWTDSANHRMGRSDLNLENLEPEYLTEVGRVLDPAASETAIFWSANQGVAANPGADIYQWSRGSGSSGTLTDLAPDSAGNGIEVQGVLGASSDTSYVYFAANGVPDNLGTSSNAMGESATPGNCKGLRFSATGTCNLYVAHGGQVDFIARLNAKQVAGEKDSGDVDDWIAGRGDVERTGPTKTARVSADGRVLVFRSQRQLTGYDNQGPRCAAAILGDQEVGACLEFYRFGYGQPGLACLTCDPRGAAPEGPAVLSSVRSPNVDAPSPAATLSRNLSQDGNRFFFESWDALVPGDVNGQGGCHKWGSALQRAMTCQDVYEWEAPGSGSCKEGSSTYSALNQGCIYLISAGKRKEASFFADADPEGDNVFIYTYDQLVPQDEDELLDAYDVRVGGGLASQHAVAGEPCGEGDCKGEPSAPPATRSPGSAGYAGPSDSEPRRSKSKRKKSKHAKHKRRGGKRKAKHGKGQAKQRHRAAKQNGRAGR
jgi:hypothetical protein